MQGYSRENLGVFFRSNILANKRHLCKAIYGEFGVIFFGLIYCLCRGLYARL
jgi:hypothetical protein